MRVQDGVDRVGRPNRDLVRADTEGDIDVVGIASASDNVAQTCEVGPPSTWERHKERGQALTAGDLIPVPAIDELLGVKHLAGVPVVDVLLRPSPDLSLGVLVAISLGSFLGALAVDVSSGTVNQTGVEPVDCRDGLIAEGGRQTGCALGRRPEREPGRCGFESERTGRHVHKERQDTRRKGGRPSRATRAAVLAASFLCLQRTSTLSCLPPPPMRGTWSSRMRQRSWPLESSARWGRLPPRPTTSSSVTM